MNLQEAVHRIIQKTTADQEKTMAVDETEQVILENAIVTIPKTNPKTPKSKMSLNHPQLHPQEINVIAVFLQSR